jgi:hypothetical protein
MSGIFSLTIIVFLYYYIKELNICTMIHFIVKIWLTESYVNQILLDWTKSTGVRE